MSLRRSRSRGLVLCALGLALAACTYRPSRNEPAEGTGPRTGGALRYAIADDAGSLDPQLVSQPSEFALIRATQRGLMAFPAAGRSGADPAVPVPDLADAPPMVSPDGLTYTFRLRAGIAFGGPAPRPVTSADVKAGLERIFRVRPPVMRWFGVIAGADAAAAGKTQSVSGIATPGPATVVISLTRPANDFLWMLALPAASAVPAGLPPAVAAGAIPASGPYRVQAVDPGRSITLVRNEAWTRASDPIRPAWVDRIDVSVGESDGADLTGDDLPPPAGVRPRSIQSGCLLYLFLNTAVPPLDDPGVRRGIALAIDRASVARDAGFAGTPTASLLPDGASGAVARGVPRPDVAAARAAIGRRYTIGLARETTGPNATIDAAAADGIAAMLADAGITVTPVTAPDPGSVYDLYEAASASVPMGLARWCPDWPGRSGRSVIGALLGRGGPANYSATDDATLEALIGAATAEQAPARIGPAWTAAETRALSLATVVPIAMLDETVPVSARVAGFASHPFFLRGDPTAVWIDPSAGPEPPLTVRRASGTLIRRRSESGGLR